MTIANGVGSKYITVPTNSISRRTVFTRKADTEHGDVSDVPSRNSKINSIQRTEFKSKAAPSKKHRIKVILLLRKVSNFRYSKP
jgi:hypothetical protein